MKEEPEIYAGHPNKIDNIFTKVGLRIKGERIGGQAERQPLCPHRLKQAQDPALDQYSQANCSVSLQPYDDHLPLRLLQVETIETGMHL